MTEWSEEDRSDAARIVSTIALGGGKLIGSLQVARACGWKIHPSSRHRSVRKLQRLMPLVVDLSREMHPGFVVQVHSDHTYQLIERHTPRSISPVISRFKSGRTKFARAHSEMSVAKTPAQMAFRALLAGVNATLSSEEIDGIFSIIQEELAPPVEEVSSM